MIWLVAADCGFTALSGESVDIGCVAERLPALAFASLFYVAVRALEVAGRTSFLLPKAPYFGDHR